MVTVIWAHILERRFPFRAVIPNLDNFQIQELQLKILRAMVTWELLIFYTSESIFQHEDWTGIEIDGKQYSYKILMYKCISQETGFNYGHTKITQNNENMHRLSSTYNNEMFSDCLGLQLTPNMWFMTQFWDSLISSSLLLMVTWPFLTVGNHPTFTAICSAICCMIWVSWKGNVKLHI